MASTTIHTLAYKIVADSSKFKSEMSRTNAEIRAAKKVTDAYLPAAQRHKMEVDALGLLYRKGRIDVATYNRALWDQQKALFKASTAGKVFAAGVKVIAANAIAAGTAIVAFARDIPNVIAEIELMDRAARRMGISFAELDMLTRGGRMLDVSAEAMAGAMQNLMGIVAAAEAGNKKAAKSLALIEMSAKELKGLSATQLLERVAEGISTIDDANRRVLVTNKLLGDTGQQLADILDDGAQGVRDMVREAQQLGPTLTESHLQAIREADDAMDKLAEKWRTTKIAITVVAAGPLADYLDAVNRGMPKPGEPFSFGGHLVQSQQREHDLIRQARARNQLRDINARLAAGTYRTRGVYSAEFLRQKDLRDKAALEKFIGPRPTARQLGIDNAMAQADREREAMFARGPAEQKRRMDVLWMVRNSMMVGGRGKLVRQFVQQDPLQGQIDLLNRQKADLESRKGGVLFEGDAAYRDATMRELRLINAQLLELLRQQWRDRQQQLQN